ncbi:hypothetical protein QUB60_14835 [Microcoleus sp. A2-C5]|uniref:hypothetical protein n=1 Tax=unclassified Microcoleus TaxID=2642155 RepID=UPI002FD759B3
MEAANLCRASYDLTDLDRPQVEAGARRLLNISPLLDVTLQAKKLKKSIPPVRNNGSALKERME